MTVETTLQRMFDNYPMLFATRQQCFNQLFCTIGCGYKWIRGQLVHCEDSDRPEAEVIAEEDADYSVEHPRAKQTEENIKKFRETEEMLVKHHPEWKGEFNTFDPVCEKSNIMQVPDDIRSDWNLAVKECWKMLAETEANAKKGEIEHENRD